MAAEILYHAVPIDWRREQKYRFLEDKECVRGIQWQRIEPDARHTWLTTGLGEDFASFVPLGSKETKKSAKPEAVFRTFSNGIKSNSDAYVYDFNRISLEERAKQMVEAYSAELDRWRWAYFFENAFNEDTYQFREFFPHADAEIFRAFAAAGKRLAELHVGYEQQPEFPLKRRENRAVPFSGRVEKMKLLKPGVPPSPTLRAPSPPPGERAEVRGRSEAATFAIRYNESLTLEGIPPETFAYRLGNRSALEWVMDQCQVSTDKRSGIANDPNRSDGEHSASPKPDVDPRTI